MLRIGSSTFTSKLNLNLKKHITFLVLVLFVTSCKTTKSVLEADTSVSVKEVVKNYKSRNALDFKTLHIKGNTSYSLFNITLDIRIKKDEVILVSCRAPFVGTVIKAYITPDYISYYNKWESEYFEGDYEFLSEFLGTELDFQKVQNLLLGRTLDVLDKERFVYAIENNLYKLSSERSDLSKAYYFEPLDFNLVKQHVAQKHENRSAFIEYSNYKTLNNNRLPYAVFISSLNGKDKNEFKVDYKTIDFDTQISFPYNIPDGYKKIEI